VLLESFWKDKNFGIYVLGLKIQFAGTDTFVAPFQVEDFECLRDLEKWRST